MIQRNRRPRERARRHADNNPYSVAWLAEEPVSRSWRNWIWRKRDVGPFTDGNQAPESRVSKRVQTAVDRRKKLENTAWGVLNHSRETEPPSEMHKALHRRSVARDEAAFLRDMIKFRGGLDAFFESICRPVPPTARFRAPLL